MKDLQDSRMGAIPEQAGPVTVEEEETVEEWLV